MKTIRLLLAIFLMATTTSTMAQGENPLVFAIADGDQLTPSDDDEWGLLETLIMFIFGGIIGGETENDTNIYTNAQTGKRLFWLDKEDSKTIHLYDGVSPSDKLSYTMTEKDKNQWKRYNNLEGCTGFTITFCTETIDATITHWQLFSAASQSDLKTAFAFEALSMENVLTNGDTEHPLFWILPNKMKKGVRIAMSRQMSTVQTYSHDLSLDFRNWLASDDDLLPMTQMYLESGFDPREVRTVNLTLDPTGIPKNPTVDFSSYISDGTILELGSDDAYQWKTIVVAILMHELLNKIEINFDDNTVYNTENKKLGDLEVYQNDKDVTITIHLAEGVSSADDIVVNVTDELREQLFNQSSEGYPIDSDPYTWKTISLRFRNGTATSAEGSMLGENREAANGPFFSVDGRRLADKPTRKGVYIVGGRKVVVK